MPEAESDQLLHYLFKHQEQEKYFHAHKWAEGDVLMWDNIGTVHNAVARLWAERAALHAPGAGHGDQGLRPSRRLSGPKRMKGGMRCA